MKRAALIMFVVVLFLAGGVACAGEFEQERIAECIEDNSDAKAATEVIKKYCVCMSARMGANETRSISEWEKKHPVESAECDREAGWK